LNENVPSSYRELEVSEKSKPVNYNLMGLGKRYTLKTDKTDEATPGPGMYSHVSVNSISNTLITSKMKSSQSPHALFGTTREQSDKL
jgi:hypothetical protein